MSLRFLVFVVAVSVGFLCPLLCHAEKGVEVPAGPDGQLPQFEFEGAAHGFPSLRDLNGRMLADGDFTQWLEGGRLHVRLAYQFSSSHRIEENALFNQKPQLVQESWSWQELTNGTLYRRFDVDFRTGKVEAEKWDKTRLRRWSRQLKLEPGRTFAGFGFTLALTEFRDRLLQGETIQLKAIGFTPRPRLVSVKISHPSLDRMQMSGRVIQGDRFLIHPEIPKLARLFVSVPDTRIWLIHAPPTGFLRWEGPLAEPGDPVVRVDLLPGQDSGPAEPEHHQTIAAGQPRSNTANE